MAQRLRDDKQEYQYSSGFTTPSGHEFHYYDTPSNERLVLKHASGSHIEFKSDGSVIIKSLKDLHMHSSVVSSASKSDSGSADTSVQAIDTNYTLEVGGTLNIKCADLNVEVGGKGAIYCGTDLEMKSNNIIEKATECISLEASKSVYLDTDEYKQRSVTTRQETGNKEDGAPGGMNILNVHGNAVIQNNDPLGGITISSKGYLNLVCAGERVDITGAWIPTPSALGIATYTHYVLPSPLPLNKSKPGGDSMTIVTTNNTEIVGLNDIKIAGKNQVDIVGVNRTRTVGALETVLIGGIQTVRAAKIFLN